ncbi:DUF4124 domain-containing protein [Acidovorax facilis]|uniref:DUF4124 domain-containing protein n=1 Tax=Acidovorax facilis TaxID=12917 RepID=UPI003CECE291
MNKTVCYLLCVAMPLVCAAPTWAVNKCTGADGKVSFQDGPCLGQGEKIEVKPAMQGATPVPPSPSTAKEGAFGPTWQRKHYLQNQGVPQARAAIERNQQECMAMAPDTAVAHAGPLRRSTLAQGSQFAQERAAAAGKDKAACEARTEELRNQLKSLEAELGKL